MNLPRKVVCVGAIVIKDTAALFVRLAKGQSLEGKWSIPWGLVESNETPDAAVVRETLEESGIAVKVKGLIGYQNFSWQNSIALVYLCEYVSGEPTPDGLETDAARFFELADLSNLDDPIDEWCRWLATRVLEEKYTLIFAVSENPRFRTRGFSDKAWIRGKTRL